MKTRRTLALATAATAVLSTISAGAAVAPASAAALTCRSQVVGLTGGNQVVYRGVENGKVAFQKFTATSLPFGAGQMGFLTSQAITGGDKTSFVAIAKDGRPRVLTVKDVTGSKSLSQSSTRMLTTSFTPRLFTKSTGVHAFALNNLNQLRRLVTYRDSSGRLYFGTDQLVLKNMGNLKTISFYNRQKVAGVNTDVLYATTKTGGLKQILVPVRRPANARMVTLERSGFAQYTAISLGRCNDDAGTAYIVGVDAVHNVARSYVLRRQAQASGANLTYAGPVASGYNWRLHAVL